MYDHSMFNFLVNGASSSSTNLEILGEYAKQAAYAYLGNDQTPLNDSIKKIAFVEKLEPEQISVVCQEANKLVHTELFKTAEDKYTVFTIAKPEEIIPSLEGETKVASFEVSDYDNPPSSHGSKDFSVCKNIGHSGFQKTAMQEKKATVMKLGMKLEELRDSFYQVNTKLEKLENDFVKISRNMLLPYRIDQRRAQYPSISSFCTSAGMNIKTAERLIDLLDQVMVKQGLLEKNSSSKADPNLISENLNVRIVNGDHPLYIVVKTIPEVEDKKKLHQERYNLIRDQINACGADGAIISQHGKRL